MAFYVRKKDISFNAKKDDTSFIEKKKDISFRLKDDSQKFFTKLEDIRFTAKKICCKTIYFSFLHSLFDLLYLFWCHTDMNIF